MFCVTREGHKTILYNIQSTKPLNNKPNLYAKNVPLI